MRTSLTASILGSLFLLVACGTTTTPDGGIDSGHADGSADGSVHDASIDGGGDGAVGVDASDGGGGDASCPDSDGDGHTSIACGGDDCDDSDPNRFPTNTERCDSSGHDEDCNPATLGPDADSDGFVSTLCCNNQPTGPILCGTDCDDTRATVNPSAVEACNTIDDNCNGMVDEGVLLSWYVDADGDGYGAVGSTPTMACTMPAGHVGSSNDCNDGNAMINPGAAEICDGIDNNCDGSTDTGCPCMLGHVQQCGMMMPGGGFYTLGPCHPGTQTCVMDTTGTSSTLTACAGYVDPIAETCNMVDDNCNGMIDEGVLMTFYADADGDGFGSPTAPTMMACIMPAGYVAMAGDCDDTRAAAHPGAPETCNMLDDNCNTMIDEGVLNTYYHDADGDGYGLTTATVMACSPPPTYVATPGDCNDGSVSVHPGLPELCNGVDDNCVGGIDEMPASVDNSCIPMMSGTTYACMSGVCRVTACPGGHGDCNSNFTDGCEVDTTVSTANCSACGTACPFACAASACDPVTGMAGGGSHTVALRRSHLVAAWGLNAQGQLGNMTMTSVSQPTPVSTLSTAISVGAGFHHSCAATSAGGVSCWGENTDGQLGTGDSAGTIWNAPRPTLLSGGSATAVAASPDGNVTCAILSTGVGTSIAKCWGRNVAFQVGDGSFNGTCPQQRYVDNTPVAVSGLSNPIAISPGAFHVCAVRMGGQAVCWGSNGLGELGDGTGTHMVGAVREGCADPNDPPGLNTTPLYPVGVPAGTCLSDAANGITTRYDCSVAPVNVSGLTTAIAIASGDVHTCAIRSGGQVACWGDNELHQVNATATVDFGTPQNTSITDATAIVAAAYTTCVIRTGGQVACWGDNTNGQLGNGTTGGFVGAPVNVTGLSDATALYAGATHFCAVRVSGQPVCWGLGFNGQLGNGAVADHNTPVNVLPLP